MCQRASEQTDSTAIIPDLLVCTRKVCREIRYGADNEEVIDKFGFRTACPSVNNNQEHVTHVTANESSKADDEGEINALVKRRAQ